VIDLRCGVVLCKDTPLVLVPVQSTPTSSGYSSIGTTCQKYLGFKLIKLLYFRRGEASANLRSAAAPNIDIAASRNTSTSLATCSGGYAATFELSMKAMGASMKGEISVQFLGCHYAAGNGAALEDLSLHLVPSRQSAVLRNGQPVVLRQWLAPGTYMPLGTPRQKADAV
jgi:hypothetical protein